MTELVLDAWPVMEWFRGRNRPVKKQFEALLSQAQDGAILLCISRINLGEIYYSAAKDYGEDQAAGLIRQLHPTLVEVVSVTDSDIDAAAMLKGRYTISYADAFAVVLSVNRKLPLVTGDVDFKKLPADLLQLHWLGA